MNDPGSVTVVIPQWNRADLLGILLKHLAAQTYPITRILVIDNGSTDHSATVARAAGATVIEMGHNAGFAPAVNRGILESATEWVAIVNNDVTLAPDWLERLVSAASASSAWFAAGKLLKPASPTTIDGAFDLVSRAGTAWRAGSERPDSTDWNTRQPIQAAPMTAAIFRRELFDRVGMLDERFESYLEDVDLGIRCAAAGLRGVYEPSAHGTHQGSATRGAWHKATVRQIARNQKYILFKYFHGSPRWPRVVGQLLWGLVALRNGAAGAWLLGRKEADRRKREMRSDAVEWGRIREAIEKSEEQILYFQRRTGFDTYWRLYFMLTRGYF